MDEQKVTTPVTPAPPVTPAVTPVTTPVTPAPPPVTPELPETGEKGEKKWMVGGLIGFVVILLITAVVLLLQIRKPTEPLPSPRPSPIIPVVKEVEGEGVCETVFMVVVPESPVCYEECDITDDLCITGLECTNISGVYRCVDPDCSEEKSCVCEGEELSCFDTCNENVECEIGLSCMTVPGTNVKRCVDSECADETDCVCDEDVTVACFGECSSDEECSGEMRCLSSPGTNELRCLNSDCTSEIDCVCDEDITVACFGECSSDEECSGEMRCMSFPGTNELRCLNSDCTSETDCVCPVGGLVTPTPTPSQEAEPLVSPRVAQPELPEAGGSLPVVLGASTGLLLIIVGLLLF